MSNVIKSYLVAVTADDEPEPNYILDSFRDEAEAEESVRWRKALGAPFTLFKLIPGGKEYDY